MKTHAIHAIVVMILVVSCSVSCSRANPTVPTVTPPLPSPTTSSRDPFPTATPTQTPIPAPTGIAVAQFADGGVVLQIPKLGIETAIEIAEIVETDKGLGFTEPGDNPIWIPDWSRNIGQYGTALIYGHRQWGPLAKVFTDLDDLEPGDTVIVRTTNETFIFDVVETIVIDPDQLWSVIEMWDTEAIKAHESQLALLTCTPWGTALQRLIVFAVLQEDVE